MNADNFEHTWVKWLISLESVW